MLELNAGTGVCGVFASHGLAALGTQGRVYLADRCQSALSLLELNTGLNSNRDRTSVCELVRGADDAGSESEGGLELRGLNGVAAPQDASIDAVIAVLDPFDDEEDDGGAEALELWTIIGRYLSTATGAWVALSCVEASTLVMREDGEIVGISRTAEEESSTDGGGLLANEQNLLARSLSAVAKRVLEEVRNSSFLRHLILKTMI